MRPSGYPIALFCLCLSFTLGLSCPSNFQFGNTTAWTARTVNNNAGLLPNAVAVADFDVDGRLDIVAGYQGEGATLPAVHIFFQQDVNTFTAVQVASHADLTGVVALVVADLDSDTHRDIVAACNGRLIYLHSPVDPRQAAGWTMSTIDQSSGTGINQWNDVATGSIDGANGTDIVACNANTGRLSWFTSPASPTSGTGWLRVDIDATTRTNAAGVAVEDVDGDGRNDVISTAPGETTSRVAWYKNPANPSTGTWTKNVIGNLTGASRIAVGDLDGDTRRDLVVTNPTNRQIGWYQKPATATSVWTGYQLAVYTTNTPSDVKLADVNGDGQLEVIVATFSAGSLRWFGPVGAQTLGWGENNLADLTEAVGRIAVGDIDGDGRPDVVAPLQGATSDLDRIAWFENPL